MAAVAGGLLWVSEGARADLAEVGPVDPANGFPQWYADTTGLALEQCLSQSGFCLTDEPDPTQPISFPDNFPGESFYFNAQASIDLPGGGTALLVVALESAFFNGDPAPGDQIVFARVRIRVDTPNGGDFTVIHPYGEEFFPNVSGGRRTINFTRDIGGIPGIFDDVLAGDIGPFLVSPAGPVVDLLGAQYLADPNFPTLVTGSPNETNFFRIVGPNIGGRNVNEIETAEFFLSGKIAGEVEPPPPGPIAADDTATAFENASVDIDVLANDVAGPTGAPINPATVQIVVPPDSGITTISPSGLVNYAPEAFFFGLDTFAYIVRDENGGISNVATVTVDVINVNDAPIAVDDAEAAFSGEPVVLAVTDNDDDPDDNLAPETAAIQDAPANGAATVDANGDVTYVSVPGFVGVDTFTYIVRDTEGLASNLATVTVTVSTRPAEILVISRGEFRAARSEWKVDGTTSVPGPANFVDLYTGQDLSGAFIGRATVNPGGAWSLRVRNSAVRPAADGVISARSSLGTIVSRFVVRVR